MWYALVHDEQLGPMPDTELAELHVQGVISDDTLVWTATMSDWRPVREVSEIQLLLAEPELLDDEEGEGATMMMVPGDSDWAALLNAPAPAPEMPAVSVEHTPVTDARTAMLSPDELPPELRQAGLLAPQTPAAPPLPAFGAEEPGTGSIVEKFPDAPPVPAADDSASDDAAVFAPIDPTSPPADSKRSKLPLILLLLLLIGGCVVAAVILMGPGDRLSDPVATPSNTPETTPATSASVAAATAPPVKDAGVPDAGKTADAMIIALDDLEPEAPPSVAPSSKDAPTSVASATPKSAPSEAPATRPKSVASKAPPSVAKASPKTRKRPPRTPKTNPPSRKPRTPRTPVNEKPSKDGADLPVQLSRNHIKGVLQRSGGALRSCAGLDDKVKEGTFAVNVVIKRSGVVHSAKVITARLRKSPAAKCIEGQVKRFRFGRFKGDPMRIQLPFRL